MEMVNIVLSQVQMFMSANAINALAAPVIAGGKFTSGWKARREGQSQNSKRLHVMTIR